MPLKRKRVKIPEDRLGRLFMHLRFLVQRRIRSWRVFFGELHLFRNVSQAFRFRVWLSRRKAKKQLQAREVRKTLPKIDTEERLDQWFSMLLSPNKPASFWMIQFALILLVLSPLALGAYHFMRSWRIDNLYEASVAALEDDDLLTAWRTAHAKLSSEVTRVMGLSLRRVASEASRLGIRGRYPQSFIQSSAWTLDR